MANFIATSMRNRDDWKHYFCISTGQSYSTWQSVNALVGNINECPLARLWAAHTKLVKHVVVTIHSALWEGNQPRRRIYTEEKAKVVTAGGCTWMLQFGSGHLAARRIWKKSFLKNTHFGRVMFGMVWTGRSPNCSEASIPPSANFSIHQFLQFILSLNL